MEGRSPTHVVTGVGGFIGSTTAEQLLARGHRVIGIDSLNEHYDPQLKLANLADLNTNPRFQFVDGDLVELDLESLFEPECVVYHLAAFAGVRESWASLFSAYVDSNIRATHRLLDAAVARKVGRVVYASSSSVYGNATVFPVRVDGPTNPHSPYGVTKLAGEHLCSLYGANQGLSTVSLRYFTVYGPRQRPDMATHRIIECGLSGGTFDVFGDGTQRRDFTFVGDVAAANVAAGRADVAPGSVYNVAGGSDVSLNDLLDIVGEAIGSPVNVRYGQVAAGDVRRTGGLIDDTTAALDWKPETSLEAGVAAQVAWHRSLRPSDTSQNNSSPKSTSVNGPADLVQSAGVDR